MSDDFFAPPSFQPDVALAGLRRSLSDLKLVQRDGRYEWRGLPVVELAVEADAIRVRSVERPARSPDWRSALLKNAAEVRRFVEEMQRRLARWSERDD